MAYSAASDTDGWSDEELARMSSGISGRGALAESDGRCFMALLDMCHVCTGSPQTEPTVLGRSTSQP
jgi:hypothetical protein